MIKKLYPTAYIASIYDMDVEGLKKQGIKGIIFDIDNTLVPYDVVHPTEEVIEFFTKLQEEGFKITLVSNNTKDRVMKFNEKLKVIAIHESQKPLGKGFRKALHLMACKKEEVVIVGDQIFTDVYGGNLVGIQTILVKPVSDKDEWKTKIKRGIEKRVIRSYERNLYKGK